MCHELLLDARFHEHLLKIDTELCQSAQARGCPRCHGRLDRADYPRKPRGGPPGLGPEHAQRFSLCCAACRKRTTPVSVRFLGRRVYFGAVLVMVMERSATRAVVQDLRAVLGVDRRTVRRWIGWWRKVFVRTSLWVAEKGHFMPSVDEASLPGSLLGRFAGELSVRLNAVLRFLSPLSSQTAHAG